MDIRIGAFAAEVEVLAVRVLAMIPRPNNGLVLHCTKRSAHIRDLVSIDTHAAMITAVPDMCDESPV
jgi:hypothetical protein